MTYREQIELYKQEKLSKDDAIRVSNDIEKHEAISEYLFDREEENNVDFHLSGFDTSKGETDEKFTKLVKKTIRKTFIKTGAVILALSIAVVIFIVVALPNIVSQFYYNPGKEIGKDTNQMSLDMAVYSELYLPPYERNGVQITANGYGNYDVVIPQCYSFGGSLRTVVGKIEKSKLTLYDQDVLKKPYSNIFAWNGLMDVGEGKHLEEAVTMKEKEADADTDSGGHLLTWFYTDKKAAEEELMNLNENETYIGYVTMDTIMDYNDFKKFMKKTDVSALWCAAKTGNENGWITDNIGFSCNMTVSTGLYWNEETYPELKLWKDGMKDDEVNALEKGMESEEYMKTHFVSLLNYMADNEEFVQMMDQGGEYSVKETYAKAAEYVEKNGIKVYGCVVVGDKAEMQKLSKYKEVYGIICEEQK